MGGRTGDTSEPQMQVLKKCVFYSVLEPMTCIKYCDLPYFMHITKGKLHP